MRNYFLCYLAIATLLSFISCSQDDPAEEDVRKEVKVTATFKGLSAARNATTRVTDNSWENVDAIGLFMMKSGVALDQDALANNVKYTFIVARFSIMLLRIKFTFLLIKRRLILFLIIHLEKH